MNEKINGWDKRKCPKCGSVENVFVNDIGCPVYQTCIHCKFKADVKDWLPIENKEPSLPLDMSHTVISAETEKQMIEMTRKPKRVRKFKDDYVEEVKQLTVKLHDSEARNAKFEYEKLHGAFFDNFFKMAFERPSIKFALSLLWKAVCQKARMG